MKSQSKQRSWIEKYDDLFGKLGDAAIAKRAEVSRGYVKKLRLQKGIHIERKRPPWTAAEDQLLGEYTDRETARLLVRDINEVTQRRRIMGRPAGRFTYNRWTDAELLLLGTAPDREIAGRLGRSLASVQCQRARLKLPLKVSALHRWSKKETKLLGRMPDEEVARRLDLTSAAMFRKR